jgi:PPK2 family polyphosphate:nucleotide phosphotransferase
MKLKSSFLVKPHTKVRLSRLSTSDHPGFKDGDKDATDAVLADHRKKLARLQEVLYAGQQKAFLIVLQGMDTAGKDGTIAHIFSGVNPQGCQVASFKPPTPLEARHDFLWRCHKQVPPRGMIGIFNRSHYEDVLWPRVHGSMDKKQLRRHLDDINEWETMLTDNDVVILKFFLHISRDEQTRRLQDRIDTPDKHWKLSPADFAERKFWPAYMDAHEDTLSATSHERAPWFIIPSDAKWFRNISVSRIVVDAMESLKLKYPPPSFDPKGIKLEQESLKSVEKKAEKRRNEKAINLDAQTVTYGRR